MPRGRISASPLAGPDAVVVGSGPNGLAAAITLARAGLGVEVFEGATAPGGGCRTAELTLPGFAHDVCAAVHPLACLSPFFSSLDLESRGVTLREPEVACAHPLGGERAVALQRSLPATAQSLGGDASRYLCLLGPLARDASLIFPTVLSPVREVPRHPVATGRFALEGARSVTSLAKRFASDEARALLAGLAAHSNLPLSAPLTSAFALVLAVAAHQVGWPVVEGGSHKITGALVAELESLGGRVHTGRWVHSLDELPKARATLLDVTPRQLVGLAARRLSPSSRRRLSRYRYGPGVFKIDYALAGPVPWLAAECRRSATVHVGGTLEQIARAEAEVAAGRHPESPFVIVVQPGVVDSTRAPGAAQTLWAYCHVPSHSTLDRTAQVDAAIERLAPGFGDLVLARATKTAAEFEASNPNDVGGDIGGGLPTIGQMIARPQWRWNPYRTAIAGVYLCSSATPPGPGVHGMCGWHAARAALTDRFGIAAPRWPSREEGEEARGDG